MTRNGLRIVSVQWVIAAAAVTALVTPGLADPDDDAKRVKSVMQQIDKGRKQLKRADTLTTDAARLKALDRALNSFRLARKVAKRNKGPVFEALLQDANPLTVKALNEVTTIYDRTNSRGLALKRNREALGIAPGNLRAKSLRDTLARPRVIGVPGPVKTAAQQRMYERRQAGALGFVNGIHGKRRYRTIGYGGPGSSRRFRALNSGTVPQGTGTPPRTTRPNPIPRPVGSAVGPARRKFGGTSGLTGFRGAIR